ncbi:ferredoxin family protein [Antrihabitans sp. YC3-6]|uniref:Ferredoxin n=1 Tax=Antrihabitans stalagmiti TaxID=2799499 RepID=A0A934NQA2_9NOCA|nr:ferredoxin family protein [Antrihabitans stalagmiti]
MSYVIAEPCIDVMDRACIDECPVDCIYEGPRKLYIHPDECIDCSACEPACPVEAIFFAEDLPTEWHVYADANVDFFTDLGSPGGAAAIGRRDRDAACVAARPIPAIRSAQEKHEVPPVWVSLGKLARRWLQ